MTMTEIPLTQSQVALVDDGDYDWLSQWKWHAIQSHGTWYGARHRRISEGDLGLIYMHREIMGNPPNDVDHINGNGLDNQRSNLRHATNSQNQRNRRRTRGTRGTSQYKGVYWHLANHKWCASIQVNQHNIYLGSFDSEEDAARAYDKAALEHFGEFASPNFEVARNG